MKTSRLSKEKQSSRGVVVGVVVLLSRVEVKVWDLQERDGEMHKRLQPGLQNALAPRND